jgi:hypothetical protein
VVQNKELLVQVEDRLKTQEDFQLEDLIHQQLHLKECLRIQPGKGTLSDRHKEETTAVIVIVVIQVVERVVQQLDALSQQTLIVMSVHSPILVKPSSNFCSP